MAINSRLYVELERTFKLVKKLALDIWTVIENKPLPKPENKPKDPNRTDFSKKFDPNSENVKRDRARVSGRGSGPIIRTGPRGGQYTVRQGKNGPYRRYF